MHEHQEATGGAGGRVFTRAELAAADGKDGRAALIAFGGEVYDVSGSRLWPAGRHFRRHHAGEELTAEMMKAPHGDLVLRRLPRVGVLE